jgi:hypothetical protein
MSTSSLCVDLTNVVSLYYHVWKIYLGKILDPHGKVTNESQIQVSDIPTRLMQWFFQVTSGK